MNTGVQKRKSFFILGVMKKRRKDMLPVCLL